MRVQILLDGEAEFSSDATEWTLSNALVSVEKESSRLPIHVRLNRPYFEEPHFSLFMSESDALGLISALQIVIAAMHPPTKGDSNGRR